MSSNEDQLEQLRIACDHLESLAGEDVEAVELKSLDASEAPFLAKIVSKLSPMVSNLLENRIVNSMDNVATDGHSWMRQDPGFPDALLVDNGTPTTTGIELKAWYVLSTEITARFRVSQRLLEDRNVNVVIIAWCMSHVIFGKPKILGIFNGDGSALALSRDMHYHQPPEYLTIEPQDTSARTENLRQSNVSGYKLQVDDSDAAALSAARRKFAATPFDGNPSSETAQAEAQALMTSLVYRLDTNFAKLKRIQNEDVDEFRTKMMESEYLGLKLTEWRGLLGQLEGDPDTPKTQAAIERVKKLYPEIVTEEPQAEIVVESEDAE